MSYIIDGHNLIPKVPGIDLADPDDELAVIQVLQEFARKRRTRIEVYFDKAPPSRAGSQSYGLVRAYFVREDSSADAAIKTRLARLGKSAKNWTVVSSDREILVEARSLQSKVIQSAEFVGLLREALMPKESGEDKGVNPEISGKEVDYWLDQFSRD